MELNREQQMIVQQVSRIVFLATPHRGLKRFGAIGAIAATILKYSTLGLSTNDYLVKSLKSGDETLAQIVRSFLPRAAKVNIISFFKLECLPKMPFPIRHSL